MKALQHRLQIRCNKRYGYSVHRLAVDVVDVHFVCDWKKIDLNNVSLFCSFELVCASVSRCNLHSVQPHSLMQAPVVKFLQGALNKLSSRFYYTSVKFGNVSTGLQIMDEHPCVVLAEYETINDDKQFLVVPRTSQPSTIPLAIPDATALNGFVMSASTYYLKLQQITTVPESAINTICSYHNQVCPLSDAIV